MRRIPRNTALAAIAVLGGLGALTLPGAYSAPARVASNPPPLSAAAPEPSRTVTNPTLLSVAPAGGVHALAAAPGTPAAPGEKRLDLHVVFTTSRLFNPATDHWDTVRLRGYAGTDAGVSGEYVAPTIPVTPGDTIHIVLHNDLPDDPSCNSMEHMTADAMDVPHCFNGTNLHTHGLWVSPTGNGDNVLLSINPHQTFEYVVNIPSDHPAGTFWYHSHRHGSTALQVSSGMAGAIIIRGNRLPTPQATGDIDTLLKDVNGAPVPEEVLVLQQIQYGCLDANGNIKVKTADPNDPKSPVIAWVCDPGDVGTVGPYKNAKGVLGYEDANGNGYGPGNWAASGRYTSVNGVVLPTFLARAGQIKRWRMIHGGVRDTISVQFFRMKPKAPKLESLSAKESEAFIAGNCVGDPIPYHIIAYDGLTAAAARRTTVTTLQPGYRADALVMFPDAGDYCVIDASSSPGASVAGSTEETRQGEPGRLLGKVSVSPGTAVHDIGAELTRQLIAAAQRTMPANVRAKVVADLADGLQLTSFVPHPTIAAAEVTGHQELSFFIDVNKTPTGFEVGSDTYAPRPYDPNRVDRYLTLGGVDEWKLQSLFVSHPFHIHVNPFQIVAILDPSGKDVSAPGAVDDYALGPDGNPIKGTPDPQYPGLKGVWKDTLWVKNINPTRDSKNPIGIYTLIVRTRYQRYIGEFVLHCHILDHEDQGMMQNVSIVPPSYQAPGGHM